MPDTITEGPWIELLGRMGVQGVQDRYRVTGEHLHSVCLLHGTFEAKVTVVTVIPRTGRQVLKRPIRQFAIQVWCWPRCGYRLAWLT